MDGSRPRERRTLLAGGLAGLTAIALMLLASALIPRWPDAASTTAEVAAYFESHRTGFLAQVWLYSAGAMLLIPWAAAWHSLFASAGRPIAGLAVLGGTVLFVGAFCLFFVPWMTIACRPEMPSDTVRPLYDIGLLGQFPGVGMPLALLFGALTAGATAIRALPKRTLVLTAVSVPVNLALAACTAREGLFAPSGPIGFASVALSGFAILAASIEMILRAVGIAEQAAPAQP